MKSGFLVIEGLEGAGKTTACDTVASVLREHGIQDIIFTREPGGTAISEKLRDLFKNGANGELPTVKAELLMLYAARAQLVDSVIKPALEKGSWVVSDRHDLSSQAYQGGGRGADKQLMSSLRDVTLGCFRPDLTIYLDVPPLIGLQRVKMRGYLDRIEQEVLSFFTRTRDRYLSLVALDESIVTVDATQPLEQVIDCIRICIKNWLQRRDILS